MRLFESSQFYPDEEFILISQKKAVGVELLNFFSISCDKFLKIQSNFI